MKKPASQVIVQQDGDVRQKKPDNRKKQANLSHKIKWLAAVVPYLQPQPFVYNDAGDQLQRRDNQRGEDHQLGIGAGGPQGLVQQPDDNKAQAAQYKHGPVGKSPAYDFNEIINRASDSEQEWQF